MHPQASNVDIYARRIFRRVNTNCFRSDRSVIALKRADKLSLNSLIRSPMSPSEQKSRCRNSNNVAFKSLSSCCRAGAAAAVPALPDSGVGTPGGAALRLIVVESPAGTLVGALLAPEGPVALVLTSSLS